MKRLVAVCAALLAVWPAAAGVGQPVAIRGVVVTASGAPLSGARAELLPLASNYEVVGALLARRTGPVPVTVAETDAAGRFELETPGAGVFRVAVRVEGFVPMRMPLLPLADTVELPPVALRAAAAARFTLADGEGLPLEGVAVFAQAAEPSPWDRTTSGGWEPDARIAWTDAEGRLVLPRARRELLDLTAMVSGSVVSASWREVAGESLSLPVRPSEPWAIEVRDAVGAPVANAVVGGGDLAWPIGRTDSSGRLSFVAPRGAELRPHVFTQRGRYVGPRLERGATPLAVDLPEPVIVEGRVIDGGSGQGLPGALVWPAHDPGNFVFAGAGGAFRLAASASGRLRFQAHAPGYLPRAATIKGDQALTGRAPDLTLEPAAAVAGRVVSGEGEPLAGARLEIVEPNPTPRRPAFRPDRAIPGEIEARGVSDVEGRFRLGGLRPGASYRLTAELPGFTSASVEVAGLEAAETRGPLRLVLTAGRLLFGRVIDLDERPIAAAEVTFEPAGTTDAPVTVADNALRALTEASGRFELRWQPVLASASRASAATAINVTARGAGFAPMTVRGVAVPAGHGAVDLGTLILGPGAVIEGLAVDPRRAPVAGSEVWVANDARRIDVLAAAVRERGPPAAVTGASGRFALPDLTPGREFHLLFDAPGFVPAAVTGVRAPAGGVTVVLEPAVQVSGRVMAAGGPVDGAEVSLAQRRGESLESEVLGGGIWTAASDEHGAFTLTDVAPGRFDLSAFARGFVPSPALELEVEEGRDLDGLEVVLKLGATLEGWVTEPGGGPVEGAEISAGRPSAISDGEGRYRLEGLPAGPLTVRVEHPGYNRLEQEIEVEPGSQRADFELAGGYPVTGRVVDEDDLPVADVRVELRRDGPRDLRRYRGATGAGGRFRWPRVADGDYHLEAAKAGYVVTRRAGGVKVAGEPVVDVELVLQRGATVAGRVLGLELDDLARLEVRAESDDLPPVRGTVSFDGEYQVVDLQPGDWLVVARLRGGGRQADARVTMPPGVARVRRDLEFGGLALTGLVLRAGESLPGAELSLNGLDVASRREVSADSEGRFRFDDLRPGRYRLGATHPREPIIHNQDLEVLADREILIEISTVALSGVVLSAVTSEPIAEALISLRQRLGNANASLFTVGTDASGVFRQARLPPGSYRMRVRADGYEEIERDLDLAAGIEGLEIALRPTDGLDLVVRLASGRTPRFVHMAVHDAAGRQIMAESRVPDAGGHVRFATVPPGTWELRVGAFEGAMRHLTMTVPGEPLAVVLQDAGRLRVRVPALLETPSMATLQVWRQDGRPFRQLAMGGELRGEWPVVAGVATVPEVPAGVWTLRVAAPDGAVWEGVAVTTGGPDVEAILE